MAIRRAAGSSPLTRGKLDKTARLTRGRGLIPAHAGKTTAALPGGRASRAHPRSRGENSMLKDRLRYEDGSSPLTRGKRTPLSVALSLRGLIPAHAGKTIARLRRAWSPGAHPRSRGENVPSTTSASASSGSSPLTRGKLVGGRGVGAGGGLIPAHAGKTL